MLKRRLWAIPNTEDRICLGSVGTDQALDNLESSLFLHKTDRLGEDLSPLDPTADVYAASIDIAPGISYLCRPMFRSELIPYLEGKLSPEPVPEALLEEIRNAEENVWHYLEHGFEDYNVSIRRLGPLNLLLP
jgi:hypothetical protein